MINAKRAKIIAEKSKRNNVITIVYNYEQLSEHIRLESERGKTVTRFMIPTGSLRPKTLEVNGYKSSVLAASNDVGEWEIFDNNIKEELNLNRIYLNFTVLKIWWW